MSINTEPTLADLIAQKKNKPVFTPSPVGDNLGLLIEQKKSQQTAKAEGLNPAGIEQIKTAAMEGGTPIPAGQRLSSIFVKPVQTSNVNLPGTLPQAGTSIDVNNYFKQNPGTDVWDFVGDLITVGTSVIPGGTLAKTAIKSGVQAVAGAGSGALISALGGAEGIAKAVEKYPILKPLLVGVQAVGAGMSLQNPKVKPLSEVGQTAQEMGIKGTQSAEAKVLGGNQKLIDREYEIKTKYPDVYEKFINQPRQEGLKNALKEIGGEATEMTGESTGATIKSNVEATKKGLGQNFGQVEDKIKEGYSYNQLLGTNTADKVKAFLKEQGVSKKRTGQEKIKDVSTIALIEERAKLLQNAKSTEDLLNQKRQFGNDIKAAFEKNKVTDANAKKAVYRIIDDAIYESIPDKKLADEWRSVNDKWSDLETKMEVIGDIKDIEPNKIFANKVLSKGPEAIDSLKGLAGEQAVKDAGMQYLFYEATKNEAGRVNVDLIATKLKELKNKGMAEKIFGSDLAKLDKLVEVGKYVEAPLQPRPGINKYGGSQTAFVNDFIKATEMTGWQKAMKLVTDIWNKKSAEGFAKAGLQTKTSGVVGVGGSIISGLSKGTKGSLKSLEERKK